MDRQSEYKGGVNIFVLYLILWLVPAHRRNVVTTAEVCELVVKRRTKAYRDDGNGDCSFAELVGVGMFEGVCGGRARASGSAGGVADVFVSHAWGDPFIQVVSAIDVSCHLSFTDRSMIFSTSC